MLNSDGTNNLGEQLMKKLYWVSIMVFAAVSKVGLSEGPPAATVDGIWNLVEVTCNGEDSATVPVADIGTSITETAIVDTSSGIGSRTWNYYGCGVTVPMTSMSSSSSTLSFDYGAVSCSPSSCDSACGSTTVYSKAFAYILTNGGNRLHVTVSSPSPFFDPCEGQSGPTVATYERMGKAHNDDRNPGDGKRPPPKRR
jgi:hypothetical protein